MQRHRGAGLAGPASDILANVNKGSGEPSRWRRDLRFFHADAASGWCRNQGINKDLPSRILKRASSNRFSPGGNLKTSPLCLCYSGHRPEPTRFISLKPQRGANNAIIGLCKTKSGQENLFFRSIRSLRFHSLVSTSASSYDASRPISPPLL